MSIKILVKNSTMIFPAEETPKCSMWTSNIDQLCGGHVLCLYIYDTDGSSNLFNVGVLKDGLSKVLVPFYPIAGRLQLNTHGRTEILCNGKGALFLEAETYSTLEDFGDLSPGTDNLKYLSPIVDMSEYPSSTPILMVQVTRFKCGAVALVTAFDHHVADGASGFHFINSWSQVSRGSDITIPPFIDRTLLRARDPPNIMFTHIEFHPPPALKLSHVIDELQNDQTKIKREISMLKISFDQIDALKAKCINHTNPAAFTTYSVLVSHIWRCVCKARRLLDDQKTRMVICTDGRTRLSPVLPPGYLGNAIFHMTPTTTSGDLTSNPFLYTVNKIRDSILQSNDEYIRSSIDYLEKNNVLMPPLDLNPNVAVTSWCGLPLYDADFGWGRPTYVGPVTISCEGQGIILPNSITNKGGVSLAISLHSDAMKLFNQYFYEF